MGHQGGKITNPKERKKYFDWLYNLEYGIFGIPQPDLNIILHVDAAIAQKLVDGKDVRSYIKGRKKRDLHEKDLKHLRDAEKVYLEIARTFPNFCLIKCTENKNIMTREKISKLVWKEAKKILK
jgi:dTMP kinase